jgi:hypothetical protein
MSGVFPPSYTWPVGGDLAGRLAAAISAAVSVEMTRYAATRAGPRAASLLPPLVWDRGPDGSVVGAAGDLASAAELENALRPWVRALGLTRQPSALAPMAGAIDYAGMVDQIRVRVWGLVTDTADGTLNGPRTE